jgi:hypothetical protein
MEHTEGLTIFRLFRYCRPFRILSFVSFKYPPTKSGVASEFSSAPDFSNLMPTSFRSQL